MRRFDFLENTGGLIVLTVILSVALLLPYKVVAAGDGDSTKRVPLVYDNHIYKPSIKSARLYANGSETALPVISLGGDDKLTLSFDELEEDAQTYNYTVILCNYNWTPNEQLTQFDYLGTFSEGVITDYSLSSATSVNFVHYNLSFPNGDITFTKSGNYLLEVYSNDDPAQPVLTRRMYVLDGQAKIKAIEKAPDAPQYSDTHQEIQFALYAKGLTFNNPFEEVKVTVMQNFRPDNAYTGLKPQIVSEDSLIYRTNGKIIFEGSKEFRAFDTRDLVAPKAPIKQYVDASNTAYLMPDEIRSFKEYEYVKDFNGKYIIAMADAKNNDLNADYVKVRFRLATNNVFPGGNIYVLGGFSDWQLNDSYKLDFNPEDHAYEKDVLLKQGIYNYIYAYIKNGSANIETNLFEGSSYQTENDYEILVYYRPAGERWDQFIGFREINTMKLNQNENKVNKK